MGDFWPRRSTNWAFEPLWDFSFITSHRHQTGWLSGLQYWRTASARASSRSSLKEGLFPNSDALKCLPQISDLMKSLALGPPHKAVICLAERKEERIFVTSVSFTILYATADFESDILTWGHSNLHEREEIGRVTIRLDQMLSII